MEAGKGQALAGGNGTHEAWMPSERYPDLAIRSLDPSFDKYRIAPAGIERLAGGCRFNEGAVYFGDAAVPRLERHPQQPHDALG